MHHHTDGCIYTMNTNRGVADAFVQAYEGEQPQAAGKPL